MGPGWRDVEGLDLRALIRWPQGISGHRVENDGATCIAIYAWIRERRRTWMRLRIERVRILKPRTCVPEVQVDCIRPIGLKVYAVKDVLLVALGVYDTKFRWIEEPAGIQAAHRNKVSPLFASERSVETSANGAKRTI